MTSGDCWKCANEIAQILQANGVENVDIVQIQSALGIGAYLSINLPDGQEIVIAGNGWHEAVRISTEQGDFLLSVSDLYLKRNMQRYG
jgi:hypothetical protein